MNDMKRDLIRIQELVGMAFSETGSLVALTDGGQMNPNKLQKTLEQTMEQFERTTLELRRLCERYSPGAGGFAHRPALPYMDITGSVETFGYGWLHITLHTLLPHCRYQTPNWLSDTLRRLLDEYEACGKKLPFYSRAMLVIDEHTGIEGRHIYDQDNKGWKAISNAIKGRLIPDDDQHSNDTVLIIYLLLQTCYRPRISKETPGVYRSRRLFAYSMQRRFRVFRVFALTDTPRHSAKPLLFPIQATLLTFLPVFESAAELK